MFNQTTSKRSAPLSSAAVIAAATLVLSFQGANAHSGMEAGAMPGMAGAAAAQELTVGEPGAPTKVDRTIAITMKELSFEPNSVNVRLNETIRFVVSNKSEVDHELVLGDVEAQTAHRKEMIEMLEKGQDMHGDDDPNAVAVKAGETRELIWKFSRAGRFEFDCNIPGHFEAGMTGAINVEAKR
ncbi:putative cupredoxin-like copper-binding protein [Roseiarcus fermentans]|uniref:Putative cupredoxin-like copper-binding protein n=1 Tax=Roseiarcus fermentans TaxID=1473586 RepID=A0A366FQI7_9HYPH|nr:cupredoxin family protein [Roseiarcus fermentans]RBP16811.1 putative cupredoxin-like copper-binding protein [Roseiarcus fermentans]